MAETVSPSPDPAAARVWLGKAPGVRSGLARRAGVFQLLDVLAAIGFAAGLAMSIGRIGEGLWAAAPWLGLAAVSMAVRGLMAMAASHAAAGAALDVKQQVRRQAVAGLLGRTAASRAAAGRSTAGEAMTTLVEGVETLDGYVARFLPARTASAIAPLLAIAAVAVASPVCAAILAATLIPFVAGMALAGMAAAEEARRQFEALSRLSGLFLDRVRALPVILAFQGEARETRALGVGADNLAHRTGRVLRVAFVSSAVLEFFAALSVALVAVYCGFNLLRLLPVPVPETLDLSRAFFALALAPEVYAPMRRLAAAYHERQAAEAAVPALSEATRPLPVRPPPPVLSSPPTIRFEGVELAWPGAGRAVFEDFEARMPAGSITALVGPSGCGKSSLLGLLLGLSPLTGGEVWVDDAPLSGHGGFASLIAWAGQSPLIMPGSLAENIALARQGAARAEIVAVAEAVGLGGALAMRAGGLDARVDERGGGLSGGERRRLALARALLKPAPILLLDEPTANLDVEAEQALLPIIARAARGRTTLIATHSQALAALADQVIAL